MLFGALLLLACAQLPPPPSSPEAAETAWIQDIEVEPAPDVRTVLSVRFAVPAGAQTWVEYGSTADLGRSTPRAPAEDGAARHDVVGMPALEEVHLQLKAEVDGQVHESGVFTVENGQVSADAPVVEATITGYDPGEGSLFLVSIFGTSSFILLIDTEGRTVWAAQQGDADYAGISALPSWDGSGFLFSTANNEITYDQRIHRISLAGEEAEPELTPEGHHFFEQHPDGTLVWMARDKRETEEYGSVIGDKLVARAPDGSEETLFSTWDHLPVTPSPSWETNYYADGVDWTHGSGLTYDPRRDTYTFTAAAVNTIAEVSPAGEVLFLAGGFGAPVADFDFEPAAAAFGHPHGAHWTESGDLLVFSTIDGVSRAVRYEVDEEAGELREVWSYGEDQERMVYGLGELQELPDGNYLVSWGTSGILQVVSPAGEVLWEALLPMGYVLGQAHLLAGPYAGRADAP